MNLNALRAGYAQADITPPLGLQLAGGPFRPAQRILQPLLTKALVLERGADRLLLITGHLLGFDENFATSIRREIATQTGIPQAAIMLTATHTHGGRLRWTSANGVSRTPRIYCGCTGHWWD